MVSVRVETIGSCHRELHIEVPSQDVDSQIAKSYQQYQKSLQIPGFRKGKVPLGLIKARFGQMIEAKAIDEMMSTAYSDAVGAEGIAPLSKAQIESYDHKPGEGLSFVAKVEVRPTVDLQNYIGIDLVKPVYRLTDEDVAARLEGIREKQGVDRPVDRPAKEGDHLLADLQELDSAGLPILGKKREDVAVKLDKSESQLQNQLIGISRGETRTVRFETDKQPRPELVCLAVTAKDVRERDVPPLDDELAKDLGLSTLDELRQSVRDAMELEVERWSTQAMQARIIDHLVSRHEFDVPESMVESYLDSMIEDARRESNGQHLDEEYLREQSRSAVIRNLKAYFILDSITAREGIEVTDDDVDSRIRRIASSNNTPLPGLKRALEGRNQLGRMKSDIIEEKTMTFLIDHAHITEEVVHE